MNPRPRILLADDHTMLLEAFRRMLSPEFEVVGAVGDGRAMLDAASALQPDVIVVDISMPVLNGVDAFRQLAPRMPRARWIFLTVNADPDMAAEALRMGASAYLLKNSAASELFTAIRNAMAGKQYITPLITKGLPLGVFLDRTRREGGEKLTPRQREVLQLLAEGRLMKEVAGILGVSARTVAFHKYAMMQDLGLKTSAELVQYAVKSGLVRQ